VKINYMIPGHLISVSSFLNISFLTALMLRWDLAIWEEWDGGRVISRFTWGGGTGI